MVAVVSLAVDIFAVVGSLTALFEIVEAFFFAKVDFTKKKRTQQL